MTTSWCPNHGDQTVTGSHVSGGADPYQIEHLACGDETVWFSGNRDDCHIVTPRRAAPRRRVPTIDEVVDDRIERFAEATAEEDG